MKIKTVTFLLSALALVVGTVTWAVRRRKATH